MVVLCSFFVSFHSLELQVVSIFVYLDAVAGFEFACLQSLQQRLLNQLNQGLFQRGLGPERVAEELARRCVNFDLDLSLCPSRWGRRLAAPQPVFHAGLGGDAGHNVSPRPRRGHKHSRFAICDYKAVSCSRTLWMKSPGRRTVTVG
jgi:hypothetical protein